MGWLFYTGKKKKKEVSNATVECETHLSGLHVWKYLLDIDVECQNHNLMKQWILFWTNASIHKLYWYVNERFAEKILYLSDVS